MLQFPYATRTSSDNCFFEVYLVFIMNESPSYTHSLHWTTGIFFFIIHKWNPIVEFYTNNTSLAFDMLKHLYNCHGENFLRLIKLNCAWPLFHFHPTKLDLFSFLFGRFQALLLWWKEGNNFYHLWGCNRSVMSNLHCTRDPLLERLKGRRRRKQGADIKLFF